MLHPGIRRCPPFFFFWCCLKTGRLVGIDVRRARASDVRARGPPSGQSRGRQTHARGSGSRLGGTSPFRPRNGGGPPGRPLPKPLFGPSGLVTTVATAVGARACMLSLPRPRAEVTVAAVATRSAFAPLPPPVRAPCGATPPVPGGRHWPQSSRGAPLCRRQCVVRPTRRPAWGVGGVGGVPTRGKTGRPVLNKEAGEAKSDPRTYSPPSPPSPLSPQRGPLGRVKRGERGPPPVPTRPLLAITSARASPPPPLRPPFTASSRAQ